MWQSPWVQHITQPFISQLCGEVQAQLVAQLMPRLEDTCLSADVRQFIVDSIDDDSF